MDTKQELTTMNSSILNAEEIAKGPFTITNTGNLNTIPPMYGTTYGTWNTTGPITSSTPQTPISYELEVIQGKILQCSYVMSRYEFISNKKSADDTDAIKRALVEMLVDKLFQDNLVYFTKIEDTITDEVKFIARLGVLEKDKTEFVAKKLRKT